MMYLNISFKFDMELICGDRLDDGNLKSAEITLGWEASDDFNISIVEDDFNAHERFINPDSTGIAFSLSEAYSSAIYFSFYNSIDDIWFTPIEILPSNDLIIDLSSDNLKLLDLTNGLYYIYIYSLTGNNSFTFPFTKKIIIDKEHPLLVSLTPTTLLSQISIDDATELNSIHSISDGEIFYLNISDYPVGTNSDSIFTFINDTSIDVSENDGKKIFNNLDIKVSFSINEESINEEIQVFPMLTDIPTNHLYTFEMPTITTDSSKIILDIDYIISDQASNSMSYFTRYYYYPSSNNLDEYLISEIFNYPNPFSSSTGEGTSIRYTLAKDASNENGKYLIFDSNGELIWYYNLKGPELSKGTHTINWNGKMQNNIFLSSGIYFGFMEIGSKIIKHKIAVINYE